MGDGYERARRRVGQLRAIYTRFSIYAVVVAIRFIIEDDPASDALPHSSLS